MPCAGDHQPEQSRSNAMIFAAFVRIVSVIMIQLSALAFVGLRGSVFKGQQVAAFAPGLHWKS